MKACLDTLLLISSLFHHILIYGTQLAFSFSSQALKTYPYLFASSLSVQWIEEECWRVDQRSALVNNCLYLYKYWKQKRKILTCIFLMIIIFEKDLWWSSGAWFPMVLFGRGKDYGSALEGTPGYCSNLTENGIFESKYHHSSLFFL